jgi:YVTN family beta-propeller protein
MRLRVGVFIIASAATATAAWRVSHAELGPRSRLPTGVRLDPAGTSIDVDAMPLAMVASPDGKAIVLASSGYGQQGLQVVDRTTGQITQSISQRSFLGIVFSPDGRRLYSAGGSSDVVYAYAWDGRHLTRADSMLLAGPAGDSGLTRYAAGLGVSPDGRQLYVAENTADSIAVIDVETKRVVERMPTEHLPYAVAVASDGFVYVSAWGGRTVSVFAPSSDRLVSRGRIVVGRHPSALCLSRDGARLFVASASTDRIAVVDTRRRAVVADLLDAPPAGPAEGSTPNALALSADGTRLFVAEADNNAVAVFDLSSATSSAAGASGTDALVGRVPVGWYPTAVLAVNDTLVVANGKGSGSRPNPDGPEPENAVSHRKPRHDQYTLALLHGTLTLASVARASAGALAPLTARVTRANGWDHEPTAFHYPPIRHVVYVIRENRTYDQILGDMPGSDGDTALVLFGRHVTPNDHALAARFGVFDRFFVNAEVSYDGHDWSTAAYATDYREKTVPAIYSGRRKGHLTDADAEGDAATEPAGGYLWNAAQASGISYRNYGEFVNDDRGDAEPYTTTKSFLATHTDPRYPGADLKVTDQRRADLWLDEFTAYVKTGTFPALETVWLPRDHTAGMDAGYNTPFAMLADNDYALGRIVEAISGSRYWSSTAVVVVEDDAQDGPDHVDSHRSVLLVISPWTAGGIVHRFVNTTDVLATIEDWLGLRAMSQFDHFGRPLRTIWRSQPDLRPYVAIHPLDDLAASNPDTVRPSSGPGGSSGGSAFRGIDRGDARLLNHVLWAAVKGPRRAYPGTRRASVATLLGP